MLLSQIRFYPLPVFDTDEPVSTSPVLPDYLATFLSYTPEGGLRLTGILTQAQCDVLKNALPTLGSHLDDLFKQCNDWQADVFLLGEDTAESAKRAVSLLESRPQELIHDMLVSLVPILEADTLAGYVAGLIGLGEELAVVLLARINVTVAQPAGASRPVLELLTNPGFLGSDPSQPPDVDAFADQLRALVRLDKAARLLAGVNLAPSELCVLLDGTFEILAFDALPSTASEPSASFADWRSFRELLAFRDAVAGGGATLQTLAQILISLQVPGLSVPSIPLHSARKPVSNSAAARMGRVVSVRTPRLPPMHTENGFDLFAMAYDLTGDQVKAASDQGRLAISWPSDFRKPSRLLSLVRFLHLLKLLGTKVEILVGLAADSPDGTAALAARKLFMAQFDADTLSQRLKPISDRLRVVQRDALVSYLVARDHLGDANALLDYYLIDVEMGSCMLTSRIKTLT